MSTPLVKALRARLLTALVVGEYLPGTSLPSERDLAPLLGTSRASASEALHSLAQEGLLEVRVGRGGGYFVLPPNQANTSEAAELLIAHEQNITDTIKAMSKIYGLLAAEAAINKTQEDVDLIKSANIRFIEAPTGRSKQIADGEFHQSIFKAAASPALTDAVLFLEKRVSLSAPEHPWGGANVHEDLEARAASDHSRLVELIEKGDANTASSVAERHVLLDLEVIHRARIAAEIRPVKAD